MHEESPHVHVQIAGERGLDTWDQRTEQDVPEHGEVLEASYVLPSEGSRPGWLGALLGRPSKRTVGLAPPFDDAGHDVHDLLDARVAYAAGDESDLGQIRRIAGTVVALSPRRTGDEVAVRDTWVLDAPAFRVVEAFDFAVRTPDGETSIVCCAMAPLVVARPVTLPLREIAPRLAPRARRILDGGIDRPAATVACVVEVKEGDRVEIAGLVTDLRATAPRFDLGGRGLPYRGAAPARNVVVGDEPGLRLVVRAFAHH